jgi:hypothetical protein
MSEISVRCSREETTCDALVIYHPRVVSMHATCLCKVWNGYGPVIWKMNCEVEVHKCVQAYDVPT